MALRAISAGFRNVVPMSDHGGPGQDQLKKVAKNISDEWAAKGKSSAMK